MKKYLIPLLAIMFVTSIANAQFVPPKLSPGCNPTAQGCNIAPPINASDQYQFKNSNIFIKILNQGANAWPLFYVKPFISWNPVPAANSSSPYGIDTNGSIRGQYLVGTSMRVGTPKPNTAPEAWINNDSSPAGFGLFLPYAADPNTASMPSEQPLCATKGTGLVKKCTTPSGGGGGGSVSPVISFQNFKVDNQSVTPNTGTVFHYIIKDTAKNSAKVEFSWPAVSNAITCVASGDIDGLIPNSSNLQTGGSWSSTFSGEKSFSLTCKGLSAGGDFVLTTATVDMVLGDSGDKAGYVNIVAEQGNTRYRDNTDSVPIKIITKSNIPGATMNCDYKTYLYSRHYNGPTFVKNTPGNGENKITKEANIRTRGCSGNGNNSGCWQVVAAHSSGSRSTPDGTQSFDLKCSDFFFGHTNSPCDHGSNALSSIDIEVECYNNKAGQTKESPTNDSLHIEWIDPKVL